MVVVQALDALLQLVILGALLDADKEEVIVGIQGELVHGVHASQIIQHEVQDGSPHTAGLVGSCSSLYLLCSRFCYLHMCTNPLMPACVKTRPAYPRCLSIHVSGKHDMRLQNKCLI